MSIRYPNANYPTPYDEADMEKADTVAINADGGLLTVTEAGAGAGPLSMTGADVDVNNITAAAVVEEAPEEELPAATFVESEGLA